MRNWMLAVLCAAVGLAGPCRAQTADDALDTMEQFGLGGVWALDCSKPASPTNRRVFYQDGGDGTFLTRISEDGVTYTVQAPMTQVRPAGPHAIHYYLAKDADFGVHVILTRRPDGRIQPTSVIDSEGRVLVKDGMYTDAVNHPGMDLAGHSPEAEERCREPDPMS